LLFVFEEQSVLQLGIPRPPAMGPGQCGEAFLRQRPRVGERSWRAATKIISRKTRG
jgi:hypothetical protein